MEDHRLGDLLRELPSEQARPGFTARVLQGLERADSAYSAGRAAWRPRLALAAAAAVAVVALSTGALIIDRPAGSRDAIEAAQAQRALKELRAEHRRLRRELQELSQPPMVYIGGNEDVDLVLDPGQIRGSEGARPAAYRDETF